ncbi:MAG: NADPH-dependent reductase [Firmicutes bacterium]|nr:NADPH-dependent reductase [Bacillota bacterium]
MKVVAFNGSPRRGGNTEQMLWIVLNELIKHGIETEFVQVGGTELRFCKACGYCHTNKTAKCAISKDPVNEWIEKIIAADGIILGSPVYFHNVTGEMKAFIDRVGFVARGNGRIFTGKIGAGLVAMRRMGAMSALDAMFNFFVSMQMYVVAAPSLVVATDKGDAARDPEGLQSMEALGKNMSKLLEMRDLYLRSRPL